MAKFCARCGKPLEEGQVCSCSSGNMPKINISSVKGFLESLKNRMGIGDPELNKGDAFEKGKQIIPDCVRSNESEIPVKQYTVATLRNRILGIPYMKAVGRMQVTNKRVIFRAPGRCLAGRTTLQHEFAIDEIAGVEARREYVFHIWDLIVGVLAMLLGGGVITYLITRLCSEMGQGKIAGVVVLTLLFGIAGCIPLFLIKKKWLLKLLCLGGSFVPLFFFGRLLSMMSKLSRYKESTTGGGAGFFGGLFSFLALLSFLLILFALFVYAIKPNLVLIIKTKGAGEAIDIKRKSVRRFIDKDEHTGYTEILPADDAEECIREIDAMINDIQKLGDFGIDKWKV